MSKQSNRPENEFPAKPPADERNIVSVDSDYEGATLEDRIFLLWSQYGRLIIAAAAGVLVFISGWLLIGWFQERREAAISESYRQAADMDGKLSFARAHGGHVLAGVALLEVAQHYYQEGDFAQSVELFGEAAAALGDAPAGGRAKIGQGVAMARSGRPEDALSHLEQVGRNTGNYLSDRVEAYYHAAVLAFEMDRLDVARRHLASVQELDTSQMWAGRATQLERRLPEEETPDPAT